MNINYLFLSICFSFGFTSYGQTFNELKSGTSETLGVVRFTVESTGYVAGNNGLIKKTIDGGVTWKKLVSGTSQDISDIRFKDKDTGYCSARGGLILKTVDAGKTWKKLNSGVYTDLSRIGFTSNAIYITGYSGVILRSLDAGKTWIKVPSPTSSYLYGVSFLNDSIGFVSGYGVILKTLDGGNTWNKLNSPTTTHLFSIHIKDNKNVWIVGGSIPDNEGHLISTEDGGATWSLTKFTKNFFGSIEFINGNTGYISGGDSKANTSTIYKTIDGGRTWKVQSSMSKRQFGLATTTQGESGNKAVYTCGLGGTILKAMNGNTNIKKLGVSKSLNLEIYPNPAKDIINFKLVNGNISRATIRILDANGRVVLSQALTAKLDVSAFTKGIYLVQVVIGENSVNKRIIIK